LPHPCDISSCDSYVYSHHTRKTDWLPPNDISSSRSLLTSRYFHHRNTILCHLSLLPLGYLLYWIISLLHSFVHVGISFRSRDGSCRNSFHLWLLGALIIIKYYPSVFNVASKELDTLASFIHLSTLVSLFVHEMEAAATVSTFGCWVYLLL
jgi:hypothetical protein